MGLCHKARRMLRAFAWDRPLGQLARLPLRLIPRELALPVLAGPNRGRRWIVGSGTHACWLGSYERAKLDYVCRIVRRGTTVFDVGAHAGFYTLALARRVGSDGQVIAIEPDPENARHLRHHLVLNRVGNARIIEAAACDHAGTVRFLGEGYLGHIDDAGAPMKAVRLDDLGEPDLIKLDVEGGEAAALRGADRILTRGRADVLLALHGICDQEALDILAAHRYRTVWLDERELHAIPPN
jgi:FkbM family methyltransferase